MAKFRLAGVLVICKCGAQFRKISDFVDHVAPYRKNVSMKKRGKMSKVTIYINSLHGVDADAMLDLEQKESKE